MLGISPIVIAGAEPTVLTIFTDLPDPSQAIYGYVVSFELLPAMPLEEFPEITGTITATDGQSECTATLPELSCVLVPATPGNPMVSASYSGDGFYAGDDADPVSHEILPFSLPEIVSRGEGIGPGLFPNLALDIAISTDGNHVALAVGTPSVFYESYATPPFGVFVYDIPDRAWDLVSVNSDGTPGGGDGYYPGASYAPSISADGRFVAFETFRSDLGGADPTESYNVYLFDRDTRQLYWVSEDMGGGHGHGRRPSVSDDGMLVAFESSSPNLVPNDTNVRTDIFVWDRGDESLRRVSVDGMGAQASGNSEAPVISGDGRYVAFQSDATDLVDGDTNAKTDIFVFDLMDDSIERVSLDSMGAQGNHDSEEPSISADGRYVVFESHRLTPDDNGFWQIYRRDRTLNATILASQSDDDQDVFADHHRGEVSADGRYVTYETDASTEVVGDTNNEVDIFLRDLQLQTTERVSLAPGGAQANGPSSKSDISGSGERVVFLTRATNLVEIPDQYPYWIPVVFDPGIGNRDDIRITASPAGNLGNGNSEYLNFSGDGRYVAFSSQADNLVAGDTNGVADIFVRDRQNQSIERVSIGVGGTQADEKCLNPDISADGRFVVFESSADSFTPSGSVQIYLYDRDSASLSLISHSLMGDPGTGDSSFPTISADGNFVAFYSRATNFVPVDSNGTTKDLFIYNRQLDSIARVISPADSGVYASVDFAPPMSADGRYTAIETGNVEVWLWDRQTPAWIPTQDEDLFPLVSQGRLGLSENGQFLTLNYIVFVPPSDFEARLIVYDFSNQEISIVTPTGFNSQISADGRFLVFGKQGGTGTEVYAYDIRTGVSRQMSQDSDGMPGNVDSTRPTISPDGRFIGFESFASNFVPNDSNGRQDVFVFENPLLDWLLLSGFEEGE